MSETITYQWSYTNPNDYATDQNLWGESKTVTYLDPKLYEILSYTISSKGDSSTYNVYRSLGNVDSHYGIYGDYPESGMGGYLSRTYTPTEYNLWPEQINGKTLRIGANRLTSNLGYFHVGTLTITLTITFNRLWSPPNIKTNIGNSLKTYADGWVNVGGVLRKIDSMWTNVNGVLKKI